MDAELEIIARSIQGAKYPEDIFGNIPDGGMDERLACLKKEYFRLAKKTHPDTYTDDKIKKLAAEVFGKLTEFHGYAEDKIKNGIYGDRKKAATKSKTSGALQVKTRRHLYLIGEPLGLGDLCNLYHCTYDQKGDWHKGVFKIVQDPRDSDLVENEGRVLKHLATDDKKGKEFQKYLPKLVESFVAEGDSLKSRKHVNVLSFLDGFYSLVEVKGQYPNGVHPADMAWMWKRLLTVMGFVHAGSVIHGAVIPPHLMINPQNHGMVLIDWCYALIDPSESNGKVKAISVDYEKLYAPEILAKKPPTPGSDIYMSAKSMIYILGGNVATGEMPKTVPETMRRFIKSCLIESPGRRSSDAWSLHDEFDELLRSLYGPPKFRPFFMPKK